MIVIVIMAILTEGISRLRFQVQHAQQQQQQVDGRQSPFWCACCHWLTSDPSRKRNVVTVLHGVQACVGYVLMLATMTYSLEFLFSVVLGLGIGYTIFYNELDNHVTTNPCCNFMQGEADERAVSLLAFQHHHHDEENNDRTGEEERRRQPRVVVDYNNEQDVPLLDASAIQNTTTSATTRSEAKRYGYHT
jgi:hypothetical protein